MPLWHLRGSLLASALCSFFLCLHLVCFFLICCSTARLPCPVPHYRGGETAPARCRRLRTISIPAAPAALSLLPLRACCPGCSSRRRVSTRGGRGVTIRYSLLFSFVTVPASRRAAPRVALLAPLRAGGGPDRPHRAGADGAATGPYGAGRGSMPPAAAATAWRRRTRAATPPPPPHPARPPHTSPPRGRRRAWTRAGAAATPRGDGGGTGVAPARPPAHHSRRTVRARRPCAAAGWVDRLAPPAPAGRPAGRPPLPNTPPTVVPDIGAGHHLAPLTHLLPPTPTP